MEPEPALTFVTFSDKPLKATEPTVVLAGNTDDHTTLADLLLLMYQTWVTDAFQEGIRAERPRVVVPD